MLFNAGNHVPDIPLVEVVGKADNAPPKQIGAIAVNVGALLGLNYYTHRRNICTESSCRCKSVSRCRCIVQRWRPGSCYAISRGRWQC